MTFKLELTLPMVSNRRNYQYLDLLTALFVTVLLLSGLLSSAKIIDTGLIVSGIPLVFDAGTLLFPLSYIFGDVLTEVYGYGVSRRVIWTGFGALLLLGGLVWLAGILPGESTWESYAGQAAYDAILGGITGLLVASISAYWAGGFTNSYVLSKMKLLTRGRFVWSRTIGSTLIGQIVDTTLFFTIAVALGVFPAALLTSLIFTNYAMKVAVELIFTPITLQVIKWLKAQEQEDAFDYSTDYNPFRAT